MGLGRDSLFFSPLPFSVSYPREKGLLVVVLLPRTHVATPIFLGHLIDFDQTTLAEHGPFEIERSVDSPNVDEA